MANRLCSKDRNMCALHAKMWEMYEGLKIVRHRGFSHLIVESDSKLLVDIVTKIIARLVRLLPF
jgi:ribonuclease HI